MRFIFIQFPLPKSRKSTFKKTKKTVVVAKKSNFLGCYLPRNPSPAGPSALGPRFTLAPRAACRPSFAQPGAVFSHAPTPPACSGGPPACSGTPLACSALATRLPALANRLPALAGTRRASTWRRGSCHPCRQPRPCTRPGWLKLHRMGGASEPQPRGSRPPPPRHDSRPARGTFWPMPGSRPGSALRRKATATTLCAHDFHPPGNPLG